MKDLVVEIKGLDEDDVSVDVKNDLRISNDLNKEVAQTASHYAYYGVMSARAESRYRKAKTSFDVWRSNAEDEVIENQRRSGVKTAKVKDVSREVMKMPKYKAYLVLMDRYEREASILKVITKAFEHKKDLVQTMCSNKRSELT